MRQRNSLKHPSYTKQQKSPLRQRPHNSDERRSVKRQPPAKKRAQKDILIGIHRCHTTLGVYAYMKGKVVAFRVKDEQLQHADGLLVLPTTSVEYADIKFLACFDTGNPEETKENLKKELESESQDPEDTIERDLGATDNMSIDQPSPDISNQVKENSLSDALQKFQSAGNNLAAQATVREHTLKERDQALTREKEDLKLQEQEFKIQEKSLQKRESALDKKSEELEKWKARLDEREQSMASSETSMKEQALAKEQQLQLKQDELIEKEKKLKDLEGNLARLESDLSKQREEQGKHAYKSREALRKRQANLDERESRIQRQEEQLRPGGNSNGKEAHENKVKNLETIKEREYFIRKKQAENKALRNRSDAYQEEKEAEIKALNEKLSACQEAKQMKPHRLIFDEKTSFAEMYDEIPKNKPNGGMFLEKKPGPMDGKEVLVGRKLQRYHIIQISTIQVDGELINKKYLYDGTYYTLYKKDGRIKMVQELEPRMFRRLEDGRIAISWVCIGERDYTV